DHGTERHDDGVVCGRCGHNIAREIAFFILRKVLFGGDGIAPDWATQTDVAELQQGLAAINRRLTALLLTEGRQTMRIDEIRTLLGTVKDGLTQLAQDQQAEATAIANVDADVQNLKTQLGDAP